MSNDPALALQAAAYAMFAGATFQAACGVAVSVYDEVPQDPVYPYLVIGDDVVAGDLAGNATQRFDGSEISFTVHVWSRAVGWPEAKTIAAAVRSFVDELTITGHRIITRSFRTTDFLRDPGTGERHAVVAAELLTHPA